MLSSLPSAKPPTSPQDHAVEYCRAIWKAVCDRAGTDPERTSSSLDFSLSYGWYQQGIPLRIVLRGIIDTKGKSPRVAYYRPSVEAAVAYWRKTLA